MIWQVVFVITRFLTNVLWYVESNQVVLDVQSTALIHMNYHIEESNLALTSMSFLSFLFLLIRHSYGNEGYLGKRSFRSCIEGDCCQCTFSFISFSFLHLGWVEQDDDDDDDDDDEQLVHMCVAMGIKPRVQYQIGYPCKDIADLFEDEVGT